MTDKENETQTEVPEDKLAFNEVLKKFRIGLKNDFFETITDDIATTGGELVFEMPELLMKKLTEWHSYIDPPTRRRIIEYWFAKKGTSVPEEVIKVAGMTEAEKEKEREKKAQEEKRETTESKKYIVDTETGAISVAKKDERPALDWDEAVKLSARAKAEKGDTGEKEPVFTQDSEGRWIINPKAKVTGIDILAHDALTRSQTKGETRSPLEILEEDAKRLQTIQTVFGGGKGETSFKELLDSLATAKTVLGADDDMKNLLAGIYKKLEGGEGKGESEQVKGLREELKELSKKLDEKEKEKLTDQITAFRNELTNVRAELAKALKESSAKNEYGIMSELVKVFDRRLGAMESTVQGVIGRPPPLLPEGQKTELTEAISEQAKAEEELDQLAEQAFYGQ